MFFSYLSTSEIAVIMGRSSLTFHQGLADVCILGFGGIMVSAAVAQLCTWTVWDHRQHLGE